MAQPIDALRIEMQRMAQEVQQLRAAQTMTASSLDAALPQLANVGVQSNRIESQLEAQRQMLEGHKQIMRDALSALDKLQTEAQRLGEVDADLGTIIESYRAPLSSLTVEMRNAEARMTALEGSVSGMARVTSGSSHGGAGDKTLLDKKKMWPKELTKAPGEFPGFRQWAYGVRTFVENFQHPELGGLMQKVEYLGEMLSLGDQLKRGAEVGVTRKDIMALGTFLDTLVTGVHAPFGRWVGKVALCLLAV